MFTAFELQVLRAMRARGGRTCHQSGSVRQQAGEDHQAGSLRVGAGCLPVSDSASLRAPGQSLAPADRAPERTRRAPQNHDSEGRVKVISGQNDMPATCPYCSGADGDIFACVCMPSTTPAPPPTRTAVDSQGELDDESEPAWVIEAGRVVA